MGFQTGGLSAVDDFMTRHVPAEQQAEFLYRVHERLGILCGEEVPTQAQCSLAISEGREWLINELRK